MREQYKLEQKGGPLDLKWMGETAIEGGIDFIVLSTAQSFEGSLEEQGFETGGSSHIVPLICGDNVAAEEMCEMFRNNGYYVIPVRYPTVPKGRAMIRFAVNAAIPDEEYGCLFDFLRCIE